MISTSVWLFFLFVVWGIIYPLHYMKGYGEDRFSLRKYVLGLLLLALLCLLI